MKALLHEVKPKTSSEASHGIEPIERAALGVITARGAVYADNGFGEFMRVCALAYLASVSNALPDFN